MTSAVNRMIANSEARQIIESLAFENANVQARDGIACCTCISNFPQGMIPMQLL